MEYKVIVYLELPDVPDTETAKERAFDRIGDAARIGAQYARDYLRAHSQRANIVSTTVETVEETLTCSKLN